MEAKTLFWLIIIVCCALIIAKNHIQNVLEEKLLLKIKNGTYIKGIIGIGLILIIYVGCEDAKCKNDIERGYINNSQPQEKSSSEATVSPSTSSEYMTEEDAKKAKEEYEAKMQKGYDSVLERIIGLKDVRFCKSTSDLKQFISIIAETNTAISLGKENVLKEKAKKALSTFQKQNFPLARKLYYKNAKEELWEKDIEVELSGRSITFIGYHFSANKVIKDTYFEIKDELTKLRFKTVGFKAFDGDDKTYWELNAKNDSEI